MWDSTIARSNEELVKTNALLAQQVAELNSRVAEQVQVERKNVDLELRLKELEAENQRLKKIDGAQSASVSLDPKQKLFQCFLPMLPVKLQGRSCGRAIQ